MKDAIRAQARQVGFDVVGFAPAGGLVRWGEDLDRWLAEGRQGEMGWMAESRDRRVSPVALWDQVRTVVALGVNYGPAGDPLALLAHPDRGNICHYARNRDYHDLVKRRLKLLARWMAERWGAEVKVFVDTAPVMEKPLAAQAGLGWQGRHTNLVSRRFGSWLLLGEIYTTLDLPPDPPEPDHCGSCRACEAACPTGAITGPGQLDARRCISYLTIEHKGHIPAALRPGLGNRVHGCDDCLAACPWNKFARPSREPDLLPRVELLAPRLADLAQLDEAAFRQVFAGSPLRREGRDRFLRNVLIAIGNSGRGELAAAAERLLDDPSPLIRAAAVWALARLLPSDRWQALRRERQEREDDPDVAAEWG